MSIRIAASSDVSAPAVIAVDGTRSFNSLSESRLGHPVIERRQFKTVQSGTDRLYVNNLHRFWLYADGYYNGATVRIHTSTNNVRSTISATVTNTKVSPAVSILNNSVYTTTALEYQPVESMRPSANYYIQVAAINSSGEIGEWSPWVSWLAPATLNTGTVSNSTASLTYSATPSALAAPASVAAASKVDNPSVMRVTWDAVSGAEGYVARVSFQDPTLNVPVDYLDVDTTGVVFPEGAVVIVERLVLQPSDKLSTLGWRLNNANMFNSRLPKVKPDDVVAGSFTRYIEHSGSKPEGVDTDYFIRIPSISGVAAQGVFHDGLATNQFYGVLEPNVDYNFRFIIRASTPITATAEFQQVDVGGSTTFNLTTEWQEFTHTVRRNTVLEAAVLGFWRISLPSPADLDIALIEGKDSRYTLDENTPDNQARWLSGTWLRSHELIKPGANTLPMKALFYRAGQGAQNGFLSMLRRSLANGDWPVIQPEWFYSDAEFLDLLEYLCAPAGSDYPMADLRASQGHSTPWIDQFPKFMLELGNEPWQSGLLPAFWGTSSAAFTDTVLGARSAGATFGIHAQGVINTLKTSPWWSQFRAKTIIVSSGQSANAQFGLDAKAVAPDLDGMGVAGYIGGWEAASALADETGESFRRVLLTNRPRLSDWQAFVTPMEALGGVMFGYESNLGYIQTGVPPGAVVSEAQSVTQEVALKSRGAGTANLGSFLLRFAAGFRWDTFFALGKTGLRWTGHSSAGEGGGTYPAYGLLKMLHEAVGEMRVEKLDIVDGAPLDGDDLEQIIAFRCTSVTNPGTSVIVVCNRDIDASLLEADDPDYSATPSGRHLVTVKTGIGSCTGMEYYLNGPNFRQHNRYIVGKRRDPATGLQTVDDPLCVAIDYDWTSGTAPADPFLLTIDDTFGAESDGLRAGNCVLIKLTGCRG